MGSSGNRPTTTDMIDNQRFEIRDTLPIYCGERFIQQPQRRICQVQAGQIHAPVLPCRKAVTGYILVPV